LKLDIEIQYIMEKRYTYSYIMLAKRLRHGYGEDVGGVAVDIDDDHARRVEPRGGNFGSGSHLRSPPAAYYRLFVYVFSISASVLHEEERQEYIYRERVLGQNTLLHERFRSFRRTRREMDPMALLDTVTRHGYPFPPH
jgi:hypothetical protein